jgi:CheY-like chemotaxis protein/HPt (histidine-containing phosphotransfer) domain-containing protein
LLIVIATESELEAKSYGPISGPHVTTSKPVRRHSLRDAIGLITGGELTSTDAPIAATTASMGAHVLVVEDEPVNATVAQGYLTELGCTSVWVQSGADAVARDAVESFDLILMDLSMPTLDGFATCSAIRKRHNGGRRVPIVALTAHSSDDYRKTVLHADMDDILSKPCTLEQCEAMLRRWITAPSSHEAGAKRVVNEWTEIDQVAVARLKRLRGGTHPDLYLKLVELFRSGSQDLMEELQTAFQSEDLRTATALCHKFAASAANVGASSFARGVRELEQLCKHGDLPQSRELYGRLRAAYPMLVEGLSGQSMAVNA